MFNGFNYFVLINIGNNATTRYIKRKRYGYIFSSYLVCLYYIIIITCITFIILCMISNLTNNIERREILKRSKNLYNRECIIYNIENTGGK